MGILADGRRLRAASNVTRPSTPRGRSSRKDLLINVHHPLSDRRLESMLARRSWPRLLRRCHRHAGRNRDLQEWFEVLTGRQLLHPPQTRAASSTWRSSVTFVMLDHSLEEGFLQPKHRREGARRGRR